MDVPAINHRPKWASRKERKESQRLLSLRALSESLRSLRATSLSLIAPSGTEPINEINRGSCEILAGQSEQGWSEKSAQKEVRGENRENVRASSACLFSREYPQPVSAFSNFRVRSRYCDAGAECLAVHNTGLRCTWCAQARQLFPILPRLSCLPEFFQCSRAEALRLRAVLP